MQSGVATREWLHQMMMAMWMTTLMQTMNHTRLGALLLGFFAYKHVLAKGDPNSARTPSGGTPAMLMLLLKLGRIVM